MKDTTIGLRFLGILFTIMLAATPVWSDRIELPEGVFYYQPAASVFGSEAAWINPAGLGMFRSSGFQFMADQVDADYARDWGSVIHREGLAVAYRKLHNPPEEDFVEYVLAGALPFGVKTSFGGSYRYFKSGAHPFDNRHFWNIGLRNKLTKHFSLGAVISNLNRGEVNGERTETEMRYSLAYRPDAYNLTFAVDMFLSTKTRISNADYIYHLEYSPVDGLFINGFVDNNKNFQIGLRTNLLEYFVGSRYNSDRHGNHLGTNFFVGATNTRQPTLIKEKEHRLALGVTGRPSENPPRPVFGKKSTSFVSTLLNVYRAADDPYVGEMVLSLDRLGLGFAQAQELRDAVEYFRSKGKQVICHISYPNNLAYYIASACDKILIPPVCQLNLVGLRAELTFFAGTLDKLGVNVELLRIGKYKTAAESYTRSDATDENREQVNRLLDDLFDQFVSGIAQGRNISTDSVRTIVDGGPYTSAEALEYGLVDGLSYRDDLKDNFLSDMPEISFRQYVTDTVMRDEWAQKPVLAVVVAEGDVAADGGAGPFAEESDVTPSRMRQAFGICQRDSAIKGVVFRINSPGGWALAGEEIYHSAQKTAEKKPVMVSMANIAASGGYYIAMPAKHIVANPATITGSIGIYGGKVDLSGLYEKIDLGKELITRGRYAGMLTTVRPFTDDEREKYFSHLSAMYGHFVSLVADSRNLSADSVDNLGQGRTWTGREALGNGLIDELGGLRVALEYTADRLGLEDYRVELLPRKRPWIILPANSLLGGFTRMLGFGGSASADVLASSDDIATDGILARMPYDILIE